MATFRPVDIASPLSKTEEEILVLWQKTNAFVRQVEAREDNAENHYVFYDGPPFATGLPHYGHLVASTIKDVVPRYWAMRGKRVERRFGWDTHGLPIEMETEKTLDLSGPSSIRAYGVDKFNEACRSGVLRYTEEWRRTITRLGRWVDFDDDYKTMDLSFMESVWWVFKQLWDKDLVYQGVRVMPYSWRLSTALSNFEANLDYRDVDDPAVTVRLAVDGQPGRYLLIWTTTPWTLPSNLGVAVGPEIDYVWAKPALKSKANFGYLENDGGIYAVARARLESVLGKDAIVVEECKGQDLIGLSYEPIFPFFAEKKTGQDDSAFVVMASNHVTTEDGTGLVHMAPAYGEDDFAACAKVGITPVDPVDEEGRFTDVVKPWSGVQVKAADKDIIRALKEAKVLYKSERIVHSYPFCWRSGTPLIYKTFPVWFIKVEGLRDRMVDHNAGIHWVPEAVGQKRFGNWLKDARDWAISRNRFWGTPLPIWICDACDHRLCLGSAEELATAADSTIDDLHTHKIDGHTFACKQVADGKPCSGTMRRVPEVFDCWFESGSMPYAQGHYPFENKETFENNFPAQFIAEGLDQTRGWFYTLLVLSTALFDKAPFTNCVVNGMVLAEDGAKMSKSKQNYPDPMKVLDAHGADALRAYLINSPVVRAEPLRFSDKGVREVVRNVILPLKNAWSFFVQYANVDGWEPKQGLARAPKLADRSELDRWILSVLQSLVLDVNTQMEGYYLYKVVPHLLGFIGDLTNWYIRLSRRRFWVNAETASEQADKDAAYATLYEVLTTFCTLMAPVLPFITESMYQGLVKEMGAEGAKDSVHLCDYPQQETSKIDTELEVGMAAVRQVVGMGRTLRERHKLKTRQPLRSMIIVSHNPQIRASLQHFHTLIESELNLKGIELRDQEAGVCRISLKANFKKLGKKLGRKMKPVADAISKLEADALAQLQSGVAVRVEGEEIMLEEVTVTYEALAEGHQIEAYADVTVALDTLLDPELLTEGLMRDVVSKVQKMRKDAGLQITDRIALTWTSADDALQQVFASFSQRIADEVLAVSMTEGVGNAPESEADKTANEALDIEGHELKIAIHVATDPTH